MKKLLLFVTSALLSTAVYAQQTGSIVGSVKDTTGALVPGVSITFTNTSTQLERVVTTKESGAYVAPSLPPGSYTITTNKTGFRKLDRTGITLTTGSTLTIDLDLSVGSEAETVQVTEQASLLQAQSGVVSSLIDSKQVVNLPLATRNLPTWFSSLRVPILDPPQTSPKVAAPMQFVVAQISASTVRRRHRTLT